MHSVRVAWAAALLMLVIAITATAFALVVRSRPSFVAEPASLLLSEPLPQTQWRRFDIAPDGSRVIYVVQSGSRQQLYLREMRSADATPIVGTDGADMPFFSPDGRRVGFWADGKLKVMALTGGAPVAVADMFLFRGATWAPDDTIIYSGGTGLWQVSANGGASRQIAQPDPAKGERDYRWPAMLPGGDAVLFTIATSDILSFDDARIAVRSLRTGDQREVLYGGTFAAYASGDLLSGQAGALYIMPFDATRWSVTGTTNLCLIAWRPMGSTALRNTHCLRMVCCCMWLVAHESRPLDIDVGRSDWPDDSVGR